MTIVYLPGVFDLFHMGHLNVIIEASRLGDRLVVGIPSDQVVLQDKGMLPIIPDYQRSSIVESLQYVEQTLIYNQLRFTPELESLDPDILVIGEYWGAEPRHKEAEAWCEDHETEVIKIPYTQGVSTTSIKNRIRGNR